MHFCVTTVLCHESHTGVLGWTETQLSGWSSFVGRIELVLTAGDGLDLLLHYLYQAQPDEPFFGIDPRSGGQQLADLTPRLEASHVVLLDYESSLIVQHLTGSPKCGMVEYGERVKHSNGTINLRSGSYRGSRLITEDSILDWADLADKAGLKDLAKLCSNFLIFNGSKLHDQCIGLGPMVLQELLQHCHGTAKVLCKQESWSISADVKDRATKFQGTSKSWWA